MENTYSKGKEVLRFIITGIICALIDFIISYLILAGLIKLGMNEWGANAISLSIGFIISVIINYLLSTYWVFKNVRDDINKKSVMFIVIFILLSAVAMGLSIGTMQLCALVCKNALNLDILSYAKTLFEKIKSFSFWGDKEFWGYFVSFCIKTVVGLLWNYFTRKYILYKAPKEN